jgi:hypothetical protein
MARGVYAEGTPVRVSATFRVAGVETDPTTVTAIIRDPDGVERTYLYGTDAELVRDDAGDYHVDVDAGPPGRWIYRFAGTGVASAAAEQVFLVEGSVVV